MKIRQNPDMESHAICKIFSLDSVCLGIANLSKDNNHPDLAYKTVELRLRRAGIIVGKDVELCTLKRSTPTELYTFE